MTLTSAIKVDSGVKPTTVKLHRSRLLKITSQSILAGVPTKILFDSLEYNVGSIGSTASSNITIINAGIYLINGYYASQASTGNMQISILKNGVIQFANNTQAGFNASQSIGGSLDLVMGDVITFEVLSDVVNSTGITAGDPPFLEVIQQSDEITIIPGSSILKPLHNARMTFVGTQLFSTQGFDKMKLNTIDYDVGNLINIANNEIIISEAGYYKIEGRMLPGGPLAEIRAKISINGVPTLQSIDSNRPGAAQLNISIVTGTLLLQKGDVITFEALNFFGGSITTTDAGGRPSLTVTQLPGLIGFNSNTERLIDWTRFTVKVVSDAGQLNFHPGATIDGIYKVIGKSLYMSVFVHQPDNTGVDPGVGSYEIKLPPGFLIDTSLIDVSVTDSFKSTPLGDVSIYGFSNQLFIGNTMNSANGTVVIAPSLTGLNLNLLVIIPNGTAGPILSVWGASAAAFPITSGVNFDLAFNAIIPIL